MRKRLFIIIALLLTLSVIGSASRATSALSNFALDCSFEAGHSYCASSRFCDGALDNVTSCCFSGGRCTTIYLI